MSLLKMMELSLVGSIGFVDSDDDELGMDGYDDALDRILIIGSRWMDQ